MIMAVKSGALWGRPAAPGGRNQFAAFDFINVVGERQRHYIGLKAVDNGTRLAGGPAVRLPDLNHFSACRSISLSKRLVDVGVERA
jgi:hypothetical protein